jgi:hypothetical protein
MYKHLPLLLTTATLAALCTAHVHAGRPLHTEDAGVLAQGDCELEGGTLRHRADAGRAAESSLQAGCGLGAGSSLAVAGLTHRAGGLRESGLVIGGKTGLWTGGGSEAAALALAGQISGARVPGGSWHHAGSGLNLIASRPAGAHFTLHANLGHARNELDHQHSTTWGVAIEHAGLGHDQRWAPMAELFGDDRERPWWNLGLRLTVLAEKLYFDISYGRQLTAGRPALVSLGFKAGF